MRTINASIIMLACISGLLGCESVADLDGVKMAGPEQGDSGDGDASGQDGQVDAPDALDATEAADDSEVPDAAQGPDVVDAADAPTSDAEDASSSPFPPTCVKPGSVTMQCNPMTNAGCGAGTACDMAQNNGEYAFVCFPDGTVDEGNACNGVSGPWCKSTLHCGTTTCTKFCCTSAECGGSTPQCGMFDPGKVGTFGWCI